MGKIVKYCAACEESFAEKFAFCPNCAQPMTAFEMNPVSGGEMKAVEEVGNIEPPVAPPTANAEPVVERIVPVLEPKKAAKRINVPTPAPTAAAPSAETPESGETKVFAAPNQTQNYNLADIEELKISDAVKANEPAKKAVVPETKTFAAAAGANGGVNRKSNVPPTAPVNDADDGYRITVIEEKNGRQRNGLLLGTMVVMVIIALSSAVYSIFNKDYGVGTIGSNDSISFINNVEPVEIEEQEPPKPDKEDGGGGGSGKEELEKASKGRLVSQSEKPITPPDAKVPQLTNPDLKIIQETQGKIKRPITEERAGLPGSDNLNPSNGTGRGGGIGSGIGTGLGSGNGSGEGSGNGSGSGSGNGSGTGNGNGTGGGIPKPPPPPPVAAGPPTPINIISKPQPRYTDAARQNNVTGTVTLKVTFMANGQIGSVSPVSGLPYGLTEQAIAAAKAIRFDPPKRGGTPYSVSKTITYNFTIY